MTQQASRSILKTIAKVVGVLFGVVVLAVAALLIALTVTEYKPAYSEALETDGAATRQVAPGQEFSVLCWNVGYGALGNDADFFMDGGTQVITSNEARVKQNIADVVAFVGQMKPDVVLFQEVDIDSDRSYHFNEVETIEADLPKTTETPMQWVYATNYRTICVPVGLPFYGRIESGQLTGSTFAVSSASRESLPESYSWPMNTVQTKRCQLVTRIPVEGTGHELVLMNVHPDAYTDEEHHAAQVRAIRELLQTELDKGNYVIAGGDWNHQFSNIDTSAYPLLPTTEWQAGLLQTSDFPEGWQFVMDNTTPTCRLLDKPLATAQPESVQYYVIDGFIVSPNVKVKLVQTQDLGFVASDHNPVLLQVELV